jgi:hypothetical protein
MVSQKHVQLCTSLVPEWRAIDGAFTKTQTIDYEILSNNRHDLLNGFSGVATACLHVINTQPVSKTDPVSDNLKAKNTRYRRKTKERSDISDPPMCRPKDTSSSLPAKLHIDETVLRPFSPSLALSTGR